MPVFKYRTLEEAEEALYQLDRDSGYWERLRRLWELGFGLRRTRCVRGVFRFRTLEEAQEWMMEKRLVGDDTNDH